jgi:multiple sugar transport system substrate-binding protein
MKKIALALLAVMILTTISACATPATLPATQAPTAVQPATQAPAPTQPATQAPAPTQPAKSAPVTIKFWSFHGGTEKQFLIDTVAKFNATHTDAQVELTFVNQSDYITTLIPTAYANGEAPDVLYVEPSTFTKYASKNMLADLTPYYSSELKADMQPSALEAATYQGKVYALPMEMETLGLFYNVDILKAAGIKPPTTWDELYAAAKALTTKDVYGLVLPVEKSGYTLFNWWPFMWMSGADILSKDRSTCVINTPEMANALDYWGRFFQEKLAPSSLQIGPWDIGNVGTKFAAMQVGGTYMITATETTYKDVNIGVVPFPAPNGKKSITVAGGQKLAVNAQSKNIDKAAEFIFWMYGDTKDITLASKWATEAKFAYPARFSVIKANSAVYEKGLRKVFTAFYDTAIPEPSYSAEITDLVGDMVQSVMFGGVKGADAAAKAQTACLAAINK